MPTLVAHKPKRTPPAVAHHPPPTHPPACPQRRWLNDKLLRDMAGTLTASDMASLFKPVPFGEQRTSPWQLAAQPEHAVLWDLFRSLEMDKQSRVLQVGAGLQAGREGGAGGRNLVVVLAVAAGWGGVGWGMRRCHAGAAQHQAKALFSASSTAVLPPVQLNHLVGHHRLIMAPTHPPACCPPIPHLFTRRRSGRRMCASCRPAQQQSTTRQWRPLQRGPG